MTDIHEEFAEPREAVEKTDKTTLTKKRLIHTESGLFNKTVHNIRLNYIVDIGYGRELDGSQLIAGLLTAITGMLYLALMGQTPLPEISPVGWGLVGIGILTVIFTVLMAKTGFHIRTANQDVSLTLAASGQNRELVKKLDKLR